MVTLLDIIGIHEGDISHADSELQDALIEVGLNDEIYDSIVEQLEEAVLNVQVCELQAAIIEFLYKKAKEMVEERLPNADVHYYINGYDSHFYIDIEDEEDPEEY